MGENDGHSTKISRKVIIQGTFEIDHSHWFSLSSPGRSVAFWIYSNENVDPRTGKGITSEKVYLKKGKVVSREKVPLTWMIIKFKLDFKVPPKFGTPGAIAVKNKDKSEFFLKFASLQYKHCADKQLEQENKVFYFDCKSWVYPLDKTKDKRVFFSSNKFCVPEETPVGVRRLREKELKKLSIGGLIGERNPWDRVYEYDYYNDLGDPDNNQQYARPILGGSTQHPYPRRLKTGRPRCHQDPQSESRPIGGCFHICVPADERMSPKKEKELKDNFVDALVRFLTPKADGPSYLFQEQHNRLKMIGNVVPCLVPKTETSTSNQESRYLKDILLDIFTDKAVKEMEATVKEKLKKLVPEDIYNKVLVIGSTKKTPEESQLPSVIEENKDVWADDIEFGRQMVAGTNPVVIQRLKAMHEFPAKLKTKLALYNHYEDYKEQLLSKESMEDLTKEEEEILLEEVSRVPKDKFVEKFKQLLDQLNEISNDDKKLKALWTNGATYMKQALLNIVSKNMSKEIVSLNLKKVPEELLNIACTVLAEREFEIDTQEWIDDGELYILDHHHFLPFINMVKGKGVCVYATKTILVMDSSLSKEGIGVGVAGIEVKSPNFEGAFLSEKGGIEWEVAKTHVAANDSAYHHLVTHWLHTHAVIEPFIIATRRQLSIMHPIHRLLDPHFKDTLHINALARRIFLNAGGILETLLFTGEVSMLFSSECYKKWRFDEQALPKDLIKRGMPKKIFDEKDKEDWDYYPYAHDGLAIWEAIERWVNGYCKIFYKSDDAVMNDEEIKAWWSEIRNCGHADQKEGWYELSSLGNLINALTTIIWIASGLHAALNFGQYAYAGWPLNRPMLLRKFIPEPGITKHKKVHPRARDDDDEDEDDDDDDSAIDQLRRETFPDKFQMAFAIAIMDVLSRHSTDEEYLGQIPPTNESNVDDKEVKNLFKEFIKELSSIEKKIIKDNKQSDLSNRSGSAKIPYKLLYPNVNKRSEIFEGLWREGITGKGIPNSISI